MTSSRYGEATWQMLKTSHHPSRSNAYPNSIMTSMDHSRHLHKALDLRCSAWMHGSKVENSWENLLVMFLGSSEILKKHHQTSSNILETSQEIPGAQGHTSGFNFCSPSHALTMPKQKIESGCDFALEVAVGKLRYPAKVYIQNNKLYN